MRKEKPKIGFVGLGKMGFPMAKATHEAGYEVLGYDISEEPKKRLTEIGAKAAGSFEEVLCFADVIVLMVNTYEQVKECMLFCKGISDECRRKVIALSCTVLPECAKEVSHFMLERKIELVDAPVSGGVAGAENKRLTTILSGNVESVKIVEEIYKCFSKEIYNVGEEVGQAQTIKNINNLLFGINLVAVSEAFAIAERCEIDLERMVEVISHSSGDSYVWETRSQALVQQDFSRKSTLQISEKDTLCAVKLAENVGIDAVLGKMCLELFRKAQEVADPAEDGIAVEKVYKIPKA